VARLLTTGFELGEAIEHNASSYIVGAAGVTSDYARTGTYCLNCNIGNNYFAHSITSNPDELYIRVATMWRSGNAGSPNEAGHYEGFLSLIADSDSHLSLALDADTMRLKLIRGGSGILGHEPGSVLATGNAVLRMNAWYVVEMYAKIANSNGTATVKVNNTTDIGYTGDTAANASEYVNVVRFGLSRDSFANTIHTLYLDDIAVNDTTGSHQTSWIGQGGVYLLKPNADGATTDWTASAGTVHYSLVDDTPDDAATTYVTAGSAGLVDLYELEDLPATVSTVDLVQPVYQATLEEAGFNQIRDVLRVGTVNYGGTTQNVTAETPDFIWYGGSVCYQVCGGTTSWGTADVNALQIGVEVV
jgi:hypothetical protein